MSFVNYDSLLRTVDSIEASIGILDYKKDNRFDDTRLISADYLITQIEQAFVAWREDSWSTAYSFEDFCRYILPYRGSNEPLEEWRPFFRDRYSDLANKMTNRTDPIEAAKLINKDIRSWFTFDPRFYFHPTDQGLAEMRQTGLGRCEDMTNVTIYGMRAMGIAVTSDYTPAWATSGNNHAWNAIVTPDGKVTPFMGAEADPGSYELAHRPAKVYRKMFDSQPGNLIFQERKQDVVPRWLGRKSYVDVTADYVPVTDAKVTFDNTVPDSVDIAYLCVFNSGEWRPIHWGRIESDTAIFTDMATDIVYLPALYLNKEIVGIGDPFLLEEGSTNDIFHADTSYLESIAFESTTGRTLVVSTDGVEKKEVAAGTLYELFYWSDGWQTLGHRTAGEESVKFENVPVGSLLWLVTEDGGREERIFSFQDGQQVWF